MDLMELFGLLGEIRVIWRLNLREFYRLRNNLRAALLLGGLIFVGMFLGVIGMRVKIVFLELSIIVLSVFLFRIAINRAAFGIEIASAIEKAKASKPGLKDVLVSGADRYIKFIAAILASEITMGLLAIWLPAHKNPTSAVLIIISAMVLVCYALWQGSEMKWWKKMVYLTAIETIIAAVIPLYMLAYLPATSQSIEKLASGLDDQIACGIDSNRPGCPPAPPKTTSTTAAPVDYPLCAGPEFYEMRSGKKEMRVALNSGCWSGQIMLPANTRFTVDTILPGDLEYKFWGGKRMLIPDKTVNYNFVGHISEKSFRLRGSGEAIISIYSSSSS